MWFDIRVSIVLAVILVVCPSLQWRRHRRQIQVGGEDCKTPKGVNGQCIDIKSCPVLLEMLKQQKEPGWEDHLRKSQCGTESGNVIKVCCPDPLPDLSVCGRATVIVTRVVNGVPAVLGAWPWMAALGYNSPITSQNKKLFTKLCGGSLISNRHVLTAAHCVIDNGVNKITTARLGDLNLDDSVPDRATPIDYTVEETFVHEKYNKISYSTDIALVILNKTVEFTKLIRPICIPSQSTFNPNLEGYEPFIVGWGKTEYSGSETTALQEARTEITDQGTCENAYKNFAETVIDDTVICAMSAVGSDSCQVGPKQQPCMRQE